MKEIPLTRIQKLIGQRMLRSKQTKPCFYLKCTADVTDLLAIRPRLGKSLGVKITSNAFLIRALALAVRQYPRMIAVPADDDRGDATAAPKTITRIRVPHDINVGFAVNAPQGLLVPVVTRADTKPLAEIACLEKMLTEKARSNKLTLEQMEGETIALSNLGAYGIDSFIGIVPPQTTTILSVGNAVPTLLPRNGVPTARKTMSLTLAADHRIVDGAYAAKFLTFIIDRLQVPESLL